MMALEEFAGSAKLHGFDAVELYLPWLKERPSEIAEVCDHNGLDLIAHISSEGVSPKEHMAYLERWFDIAIQCGASRINSHTGRDFFSFEENLKIFARALRTRGKFRCIDYARNSSRPSPFRSACWRSLSGASSRIDAYRRFLPLVLRRRERSTRPTRCARSGNRQGGVRACACGLRSRASGA